MKNLLFLFLLVFSFLGCRKDPELTNHGDDIWAPMLSGIIADGTVQLKWFNYYLWYKMIMPPAGVEPDRFKIYISENDPKHFHQLAVLRNDKTYLYTVSGLDNYKAYYFYMVSEKLGFIPKKSDTIMVMPSTGSIRENLFSRSDGETVLSISVNRTLQKVAYVDLNYSWNGGENCCMMPALLTSNLDGTDKELVQTGAYDPDWSPTQAKIVFRTENNDYKAFANSAQLAIYDFNSKEITALTVDSGFHYTPVFSANGDKILFIQGPETYDNKIWMLNLPSLEKTELDFTDNINLKSFGNISWINNESFIFQALTSNYRYHIYKSSVEPGIIEEVIRSQWDDYGPSISPDGTKMAFISNRSGNYQIWLYHFGDQSYRQLTGFSFDEFYISTYWDKIDWQDNQYIIYTVNSNNLVRQAVE